MSISFSSSRILVLTGKKLLGQHAVKNVKTFVPGARRNIHLSATYNAVEDVFETSSRAKWVEDAAANPNLTDVPGAAGDLASLGIGGYSPVGLLQHAIDFLHSSVGLPWWASIAVSTIVLRLSILPIAVKLQGSAIRMNNIRPEADKITVKVKKLQQKGETELANYEAAKLMALYGKHNCNPLKTALLPLLQMPVFISFFIALRRMANAPVEGFKDGGLFWFTDLTAVDPYYALPIMVCASFIINIEMGGESGVKTPQMEKMKLVFRVLAVAMIPITSKFPAALFMYWLTSSLFTMVQVVTLKKPAVRQALGIPTAIKHDDIAPEEPKKGFWTLAKESYSQSVAVERSKRQKDAMKKSYQNQLKGTMKLYDAPPHARQRQKQQ